MHILLRAALAAWLVTLALPAGAVTAWSSDPTLADTAKRVLEDDGTTPADVNLPLNSLLFWAPTDGADSPVIFVSPGKLAKVTVDGDASSATPDATITFNVLQASGDGSTANEWQEYVAGLVDGTDCNTDSPCNSITLTPGAYKIDPSGTDANARVRLEVQ